jgi:hypothetical protein
VGKNKDTGGLVTKIFEQASRGGQARRDRMTPEERSEAARIAAQARWDKEPSIYPRETHTGVLEIVPGYAIQCGVLENKIRVLSSRGLGRAFGSKKTGVESGAPKLPPFLASPGIKPFIPDDLMVRLASPILYRPKQGGRLGRGYEATLLPKLCGVILDADKAKPVRPKELVDTANALIRALAGVAIIALVDEVTGHQAERVRDELQQLLKAYVVEEMHPWLKMFPDDFFRQIYRLMGWQFKEGCAKRPQYIGKLINGWIYERLPTPVLPKLRQLNPASDGHRRWKHTQFLTDDIGVPHLGQQVASVTTLMRASGDLKMFERLLINAFPKPRDQLNLGLPEQFDD